MHCIGANAIRPYNYTPISVRANRIRPFAYALSHTPKITLLQHYIITTLHYYNITLLQHYM